MTTAPFAGPPPPRRGRFRPGTRVVSLCVAMVSLVAFAVVLLGPGAAEPADAQCSPNVRVSRTDGLAPEGETISVTGTCFDESKGIYVAFCAVPAPGQPPSPCGGGVAMEGSGGQSHWISSNPPPYATGLTTPWGPGGSFSVTLRPSAMINADIDCRFVACGVATRADHTRASDRSQDVIVPITFAEPGPPPPDPAPVPAPEPAPPVTEAPPETVPETTTTVPETTTTTEAPTTTTTADADVDAELTAAPASDDGGSSAGVIIVIAVVVVLLLAGVVGGVWARRRSSTPVEP